MFILHPNDKHLINLAKYADIRCCPKNPTHIDFYVTPQADVERGNPDFILEFETEEKRNDYFESIFNAVSEDLW